MKALILAAGFGTRLKPYTDRRPKPLFSLAGRALVDRTIDALAAAGCTAAVVNAHHLADQLADHVAAGNYPIPVSVRHEPEILGTGGAIANLGDFWGTEPFMVVNSDIVTDINLGKIYRDHCRQSAPVTLVVVNDPAFNAVLVRDKDRVAGFAPDPAGTGDSRRLTFTGIQVIDPAVLGYFPKNNFSSSIDAFSRMIEDGIEIRAAKAENCHWIDVGAPARYRTAAAQMIARAGFEKAFDHRANPDATWEGLRGDGSDRRWYRLSSQGRSVIVADHGITDTNRTAEIDAFVAIGRHLHGQGIPVPEIFLWDRFSGMVCLEDLGDELLQARALKARAQGDLLALYGPVVAMLTKLSRLGAQGFDPSWPHQSQAYDRETIINAECRYFIEAFCNTYLGMDLAFDTFAAEFETLATGVLETGTTGFMHRDFQSRNIMLHQGRCRLIDFQGGRRGPIQYDLASLLMDPYVSLSPPVQETLVEDCITLLGNHCNVDKDRFKKGYSLCRITRNLQMLGAFGFLTRVKNKPAFEAYIPRAAATLKENLTAFGPHGFPLLSELAQAIGEKFGGTTGGHGKPFER